MKRKFLTYFEELEMEQANALNLQDEFEYKKATEKIEVLKTTLDLLNKKIDGVNA